MNRVPKTLAIAILALIPSTSTAVADPPGLKTLPIGSAAPDFHLPGVDGKTYSLSDFSDAKVLVVIFTCNHCPTAQAYEKRIAQLHADYKDKGVALVAISPNDPQAVRLDELGYTDLGDSLDEMKIRARDRAFKFPWTGIVPAEPPRVAAAISGGATSVWASWNGATDVAAWRLFGGSPAGSAAAGRGRCPRANC